MEYYKNLSLENIVYLNDDGVKCIEEWRPIPGYEGAYDASDLGRLKSLRRLVGYGKGFGFQQERILKQTMRCKRYLCSPLYSNKKGRTISTHVIIGMTFLGHIPCGHSAIVDHRKKGHSLDNRVVNLQVITQRENASKDRIGGSSKYVGVIKRGNRWISRITFKAKLYSLGSFLEEFDAHMAYQSALSKINNGTFLA